MADAAILDFQQIEILTVGAQKGASVLHNTNFHQNRSNGRRHMAI